MGCSSSSSKKSSSTTNPTASSPPPAAGNGNGDKTHTASSSSAASAAAGGGGKIGQSAEVTMKTKEQVLAYASLNPSCADCNAPSPTWASINNGVLICTACSGVHRSLGVEISFVQSLKLDDWTPEALSQLQSKGPNDIANNTLLEYHVPAAFAKPSLNSSRGVREGYIRAKYVDRAFIPSEGGGRERLAPVQHVEEAAAGGGGVNNNSSSIGEVEFIGILVITLISCKNLVNADWSISGTDVSDPYVVFTLGRQSVTSKKIDDDLNPIFNETLMLSWDGCSSLHVQVLDRDQFKTDDPLGDVCVDVKALLAPSSVVVKGAGEAVGADAKKKMDLTLENIEHGSIQLELSFMPLG